MIVCQIVAVARAAVNMSSGAHLPLTLHYTTIMGSPVIRLQLQPINRDPLGSCLAKQPASRQPEMPIRSD